MKNIKTSIAIVVTLVIVFGVFAYVGNGFKRPAPTLEQQLSATAPEVVGEFVPVLQLVQNKELGTYIVGLERMALYTTTLESCEGECLLTWPPYLAARSMVTDGDLGITPRDDKGVLQYTWKGQALYYFAGDIVAGEANGHEKGGVWFLARL